MIKSKTTLGGYENYRFSWQRTQKQVTAVAIKQEEGERERERGLDKISLSCHNQLVIVIAYHC